MDPTAYETLIHAVVGNVVHSLRDGCFVAWNVGTYRKSRHSMHAATLESAGMRYFRQIVWLKTGVAYPMFQHTVNARRARKYLPNYQHEVIFLYSKGDPIEGGKIDIDEKYSTDVWDIHQSQATQDIPGLTGGRAGRSAAHGSHKAAAHPAAYPVAVPSGAIGYLTAPGETVLDPFGGAGSTLIACESLDRKAFLMELSPSYIDLILTRFATFSGKDPVREDGTRWSKLKA